MQRQKNATTLFLLALSVLFGGIFSASPSLAAGFSAALVNPSATNISGPAGTEVELALQFRNTGSTTWTHNASGEVRIGTSYPRDDIASRYYHSSWLTRNRLATFSEQQVAPGATGTFRFKVMLPNATGRFVERFELVAEGLAWFPDPYFTIVSNISGASSPQPDTQVNTSGTSYSYAWVSQSPAVKFLPGEQAQMWLEVRNTGTATWKNEGVGAVRLATDRLRDRTSIFGNSTWLTPNRAAAFVGTEVKPGETARFNFQLSAPNKPGVYKEYFNLVAEGVTWLPATGIYWDVEVSRAVFSHQYLGQSEYLNLSPGEGARLWLQVKNTGNTTWRADGPNAMKLGTSRPLDRVSAFRASSWPSGNRAAVMSPATVAPGETARFEFDIQAPEQVGKYQEYFRPVIEGVTWLEDLGVYWTINVNEEYVPIDPIEIGITNIEGSVRISGSGGYSVRHGAGQQSLKRVVDGAPVTITPSGSSYQVQFSDGTTATASKPLKVFPLNGTILQVSASGVSSKYDRFRGIIKLDQSVYSGRHWIVNLLGMEEYLRGIAEVPNSWPLEAQKAQMVAARTYAARIRQSGVADIFHLYNDTRSQVYYGYNYETSTPSLTRAVQETQGLVMRYNNELIGAYFYSDSGGYTEAVENVWGKGDPARGLPYLKAVQDPYALPVIWDTVLTQDYLRTRFSEEFASKGLSGALVMDIRVSKRFPSGRVEELIFTMSTGRDLVVPFHVFDYLIPNTETKSMNFEVTKVGDPANPSFQFNGKGNGHGVGLAQYSAKKMAEVGKGFREILSFFYTGVSITT